MIVAALQARSSSSRLPGKILKPILGMPMLARQIERILRSRRIDKLVVATSALAEDQAVADLAAAAGVDCYRGSLDDVLDRMYQAVAPYSPDLMVRLTGDCPLADWDVIDKVVSFAEEGGYDYASNTLQPTWPDGLDVEVVRFEAFDIAWREATTTLDREHVMPFLYRNKERFKLGNTVRDVDLSGLRWTVDEPADFAFVTKIYEALYPANAAFSTADILTYLASHPDVVALNAGIERNEGYKRAMEKLAKVTGHG
ncbi:MAG: glycosyltransferase family protein [Hyphomicrobiaceae bacterium]|nr:glycosyltransferase family protein [Hyphomicrobiaceae bacterium]